jgi:kynurenine formamidase
MTGDTKILLVRHGIRGLLCAQRGWRVIGEAANGRETVDKVKKLHADVAILDIGMPHLDGLEATRQIRYFPGEPGIDVDAAVWLGECGVSLVGSDNYAVEVMLFPVETVFPVHQRLIRDCGVPLLEGLAFKELAHTNATEFLFTAAPLPIVGGTGSPICPVAVL